MSAAWPPQPRPWWSRSKSNEGSPHNSNGSLRQNRSFSSLIQDDQHSNKLRPSPAKRTISTSSKKLSSIANAIGLKPKRQPEFAIQDPPGALRTHPLPPAIHTAPLRDDDKSQRKPRRPPARSVSSVATEAEPRTPSDHDRGRSSYQSVMTLSETDPFAAGVISVPSTPQDPARLSAYSDKSNWDPRFKKLAQERMSYASGSSATSYNTGESSGSAAKSPRLAHPTDSSEWSEFAGQSQRTLGTTTRIVDLTHPMNKSGSSLGTVTDMNRMSAPDPTAPRMQLRPRGNTESGSPPSRSEGPFLPKEAKPSRSSPSDPPANPQAVVVRQPSSSRLRVHTPPSAPPTVGLPPPPEEPRRSRRDDDNNSSTSSMRLSFASSISSHHDIFHALQTAGEGFDLDRHRPLSPSRPQLSSRDFTGDAFPANPLSQLVRMAPALGLSPPIKVESGPRTLKKAMSQQHLGKHGSISSTSSSPLSTVLAEGVLPLGPGKPPRKQRSFHHPRLPMQMPSIPLPQLRHANSFTPGSSEGEVPPYRESKSSGDKESRRGSTSSNPAGRKRLFSGTSIRRVSTHTTGQTDDNRSVFSLPMDDAKSIKGMPFGNPFCPSSPPMGPTSPKMSPIDGSSSAMGSFWDDLGASTGTNMIVSTPLDPPSPQAEYLPQQIMSPAEMLQLEAVLSEGGDDSSYFVRSKKVSFGSFNGSSASLSNESLKLAPVSSPAAGSRLSERSYHAGRPQPLRTNSLMYNAKSTSSASARPSTAQPALMTPTTPTTPTRASMYDSNAGLSPPPPRRRPTVSSGTPNEREISRSTPSRGTPSERETSHSAPSRATPPEESRPAADRRMSVVVPLSPLAPPPRARKPTIAQNIVDKSRGQGVQRKPSFLEIGETMLAMDQRKRAQTLHTSAPRPAVSVPTTPVPAPPPTPRMRDSIADNFLDFGRGNSFDTIRTASEEY